MKRLTPKQEDELCDLHAHKSATADAYNAACKAVAKKLECEPAVLKKYINAKLTGDVESLRVEAGQLETLAGKEGLL